MRIFNKLKWFDYEKNVNIIMIYLCKILYYMSLLYKRSKKEGEKCFVVYLIS